MHNLTCVAATDAAVPSPDASTAPVAAVAVDGGTGARFVATACGGVTRVERDGQVREREREGGGEL